MQVSTSFRKLSIHPVNSYLGEARPGRDVYQRIEDDTMCETLIKLQYPMRLFELGRRAIVARIW